MKIALRVPATTANLGPGYDAMGLSLNIYNEFIFTESHQKREYSDNLIHRSFAKIFEEEAAPLPEVEIEVKSHIPIARGLGSSASCIVAGLMAGNYFLGQKYSKNQILYWASQLEGHPDNVAPALLGGLVISAEEKGQIYYYQTAVFEDLSYYVIIPEFELKTSLARSVVPKTLSVSDAVYNISRSNLVSRALEYGDFVLLKAVSSDRIHEPYRRDLIAGFDTFDEIVKREGGVCFISGAGPTILVISPRDNPQIFPALKNHGLTKHRYDIRQVHPAEGAEYL